MSQQGKRNDPDLQVVAAEGEVFHTLCPGPQASYFSVAHGWTQEELAKVGAARILQQDEASGDSLLAAIGELTASRAELVEMGRKAAALAAPDAARKLAERVIEQGMRRQ